MAFVVVQEMRAVFPAAIADVEVVRVTLGAVVD
jgi:hypothetical protein